MKENLSMEINKAIEGYTAELDAFQDQVVQAKKTKEC